MDRMEALEARVGGTEEGIHRIEASLTLMMRTLQELAANGNEDRGVGGQGENNETPPRWVREEERMRRVEVPYFNGDDPYGWIFRAERYFRVNRIPPGEQLETVSICLEQRNPEVNWEGFKSAILQRFHVSSTGNPYEALMALRQEGTVAEYREQFEILSAPLRNAREDMMQAAFLTGLKREVRAEVRLHSPVDLIQTMALAQKVEEREKELGRVTGETRGNRPVSGCVGRTARHGRVGPNRSGPVTNVTTAQTHNVQGTQTIQGNQTTQGSAASVNPNTLSTNGSSTQATNASSVSGGQGWSRGNYRRLSQAEIDDRRRRNLCFRCDGAFGPGHVCQYP